MTTFFFFFFLVENGRKKPAISSNLSTLLKYKNELCLILEDESTSSSVDDESLDRILLAVYFINTEITSTVTFLNLRS